MIPPNENTSPAAIKGSNSDGPMRYYLAAIIILKIKAADYLTSEFNGPA
jgi:hypothetical protein